MDKITHQSLVEALSFCALRDVPEEWDKENVYLKALALVRKSDGSESYVLLQKDNDGNDKVVKDFGTSSIIRMTISVHPFVFLDQRWIPAFKTQAKEERIQWLERYDVDGDYRSLSKKELDKAIFHKAMQNALKSINKK
jgi:hypothetical protein